MLFRKEDQLLRPRRTVARRFRLGRLFQKLTTVADTQLREDSAAARLCVLHEDLRIETTGLFMPRPGELGRNWISERFDAAGHHCRELYFLRKIVNTIDELGCAIIDFDKTTAGQRLRTHEGWRMAVEYFRAKREYWRTIRNDIGGHFGARASRKAMCEIDQDVSTSIEFREFSGGSVEFVLCFGAEIAAAALLAGLPGKTKEESVHLLMAEVNEAREKAALGLECFINYHFFSSW